MGLFKKLFGKSEGANRPTNPASPAVIMQGKADPVLRIDVASITHAFIALNHVDHLHSDRVSSKIADLNRHCQPRLWGVKFNASFVTFTVNTIGSGFPDPSSVGPALESMGLKSPYSVVVNTITISLDGGRTNTKLLAGFAYHDLEPKIVLPRDNGCIPQ